MCESAKKNCYTANNLEKAERQKEFEGVIKGYKFKCKSDFFCIGMYEDNPNLAETSDLKSTSATTESAFAKACSDFSYDVQGLVYMLLSKASRHTVLGVSKKNYKVFNVIYSLNEDNLTNTRLEQLLENLEYYGIAEQFKA